MMLSKLERFIGLLLLIFAVGFNFWLYRLEPTATIDPNDNAFQFALVDRANTVWDFAVRQCSKNILEFPLCHFSYMSDHWVNNWAQGYNLPYYYSHIPQIAIVASWRFLTIFTSAVTLFTYYHWVIYLLLCLFPVPVYLALRVIKLPPIISGIGALLATHISTDGLYGLDPTSFLWRGYGLSSQLFAMIPMPLAFAYSYRFFSLYKLYPREGGQKLSEELKICLGLFGVSGPAANLHLARQGRIQNDDRTDRTASKNSLPDRALTSAFWLAVFFIAASTAGHLGIGIITIMSLAVFMLAPPLTLALQQQSIKNIWWSVIQNAFALTLLAGTSIFFLSYWIIPVLLGNDYHNVSFWDPVWKFDSYGWFEVMKNLFNGALFDFGRKQYFTVLVLLGALRCIWPNGNNHTTGSAPTGSVPPVSSDTPETPISKLQAPDYFPFAILFIFWLVFYFGRTTWGGLIDLVPGMKEFHISRFIVGLHAAGLILAPIGILWLRELIQFLIQRYFVKFPSKPVLSFSVSLVVYLLIGLFFLPPIYDRTIAYNKDNDRLIKQANENHAKVYNSEQALFTAIRAEPPGRVFAGRGGWWGKDFRVAETPYYMNLSTYGIPSSLWLPETWSPNSDIEQYFSEDKEYTYDLFNLRYVAAPPGQQTEAFWHPVKENPDWKLYSVNTTGYFTVGTKAAIVATSKFNYANVIRLWIQSDYPVKKLFPQIYFGKLESVADNPLPRFGMIDEANYKTLDGKTYNLFAANPVYMGPEPNLKLIGAEQVDSDMIYKTKVTVGDNCAQCMVILKQSYHPSWTVTVNGKSVKPISVFPVFIGIPISQPGTYDIVAAYKPSALKVSLIVIQGLAAVYLILGFLMQTRRLKVKK